MSDTEREVEKPTSRILAPPAEEAPSVTVFSPLKAVGDVVGGVVGAMEKIKKKDNSHITQVMMYAFRELDNPLLYGINLGQVHAKCPFDWHRHVQIVDCGGETESAGETGPIDTVYDYSTKRINICAEYWHEKIKKGARHSPELEVTLARELIKAYDHCGTDLSKLDNGEMVEMKLCSIIRGTMLSGECFRHNVRFGEGLLDGLIEEQSMENNLPLQMRNDGFRECVISRSLYEAHNKLGSGLDQATITNTHRSVFQECFADHRPYDRMPKNESDLDMSVNANQMIFKQYTMKSM